MRNKKYYFESMISDRSKGLVFLPRDLISRRLNKLNQRTSNENLRTSIVIAAVLSVLGLIYLMCACLLFHTLWYHIFISVCSSILFVYLCCEYYFESLENKLKMDMPRCCKKLAHYYSHYKGNIILALKASQENGPKRTAIYMAKIRKGLESVDMEEKIEELKHNMPYSWLKMLCILIVFAKDNGERDILINNEETIKVDTNIGVIEKNLRRLTRILSILNLQQGYNDADLKSIELFAFFSPYFFILTTEMFNHKILTEMNMENVYMGVEAQTLKALMFLLGNLSALFIHWMRKQQS